MFSFRALGRHVGAASLAGIVAGILVAGALGRIAMRVSGFMSRPELIGIQTSNGNRVGDVTLGGTLALALFVGIPAGIAGAALFASAEPWLRGIRPWHGVAFGVAVLLALGSLLFDPANFDFLRFGSAPLNVAMFAGIFLAFGALIAWLFDRIRSAIDGNGTSARVLEVVAFVSAVAVAGLSVLFFTSIGGLSDPAPALLFAGIAIVPAIVRWRGLPPVIAYAVFALAILVGAWRTLSAISQMLG
jgi:hypothetical protein